MKGNKKVLEFISDHLTQIRYIVMLDDFEIYVKSSKNIDRKKSKIEDSMAMCIQVNYEYICASLIYEEKEMCMLYNNRKYEHIISYICHEIAHLITSEPFDDLKIPYKGRGRKLQERLTERVGRLIYRLYMNYIRESKISITTGKRK